MPGRIRDEDIALVKERADIAEVVGEHVTLRNAGGGNLKGLCPFHEEKTPSLSVRPSVGSFHCFGCGEGGDAISFVRKIEQVSFADAVERLAERVGVVLRHDEGGPASEHRPGQRTRLLEAHKVAAAFYAQQLTGPEATPARQFLAERGFDASAAERFGVGYAPAGWQALVGRLGAAGFTPAEMLAGGLAAQGPRGLYDRFRGRLVWPIRDITGAVIAFGARRLKENDEGAKYLNSPETPIYRKAAVLYGLDLAKRAIRRRTQAVVVEGYTDVMACHLAGVDTAVATCGTAFGAEHVKVLRQVLMDQDESRGEVIFTFDGDEAGRRAALKAFQDDQKFVTQTFVAVEPNGMDPCELRQRKGDEAVRELVARRLPLFEFAIRSVLSRHDLDTAEGRTAAREAGLSVVRQIRNVALRADYARQLAGWIGLPDPNELVAQARGSLRDVAAVPRPSERPDPDDPALGVERAALKIALQTPKLAGEGFDALEPTVFTARSYAAVHAVIRAAGGTAAGIDGPGWVGRVAELASEQGLEGLVRELAVEPIPVEEGLQSRYTEEVLARIEELATTRRIVEIKSRVQRLNPVEEPETYNRLFGELIALEQHRRTLRERGLGEG